MGTGFHRICLIVYQHDKEIDFTDSMVDMKDARCLKSRQFNHKDFFSGFLSSRGANLVSLKFFQCDHDRTVKSTFHDYFQCHEPIYKYIWPKMFLPKQKLRIPSDEPFNLYLEKYEDRKNLAERTFMEDFRVIFFHKSFLPMFLTKNIFL